MGKQPCLLLQDLGRAPLHRVDVAHDRAVHLADGLDFRVARHPRAAAALDLVELALELLDARPQ